MLSPDIPDNFTPANQIIDLFLTSKIDKKKKLFINTRMQVLIYIKKKKAISGFECEQISYITTFKLQTRFICCSNNEIYFGTLCKLF